MPQRPTVVKYKKYHKRKMALIAHTELNRVRSLDIFYIKALEAGRISAKQLESMRRTARKLLKRSGKLWVLKFPQTPISAKPLEVRMGKGKGAISYWAAHVNSGDSLLKISGVPRKMALRVLKAAKVKLSILTKISN